MKNTINKYINFMASGGRGENFSEEYIPIFWAVYDKLTGEE